MIWIIIIIFLCFLYERLTRPYTNPYKLIFLFGKKGSGKTTNLTKIALDHIKRGWKVYSTVEIPGTYLFNVQDLGHYTFEPHSVVLIDEVGMIWDNRDFKTFRPDVRDFFKYQRQYKLKVYLFSQTFDVDLKLRNLTDEMYLLTNFARVFSIQRRILKHITIKECADGTSTLSDTYAFDLPIFGGLKITFIPRYVYYFKSYDPKKLAFIKGQYYSMNDVQEKYMSTTKFIVDRCKIAFIKLFESVRCFPSHLKKVFMRALHHRAHDQEDAKNESID